MGPYDLCLCGSGKKYKWCCSALSPKGVYEQYNALSVPERNAALYRALESSFGLGAWDTAPSAIKQSVTPRTVRDFYDAVGTIWNIDTVIDDVLESIGCDAKPLRALYLGDIEPTEILRNICRYSLYTDEVLVVNPIQAPHGFRPGEYNPLENPTIYVSDTRRCIHYLLRLRPWIESGLVTIIPDPTTMDMDLRGRLWNAAKKRVLEETDPDDVKAIEQDAAALKFRHFRMIAESLICYVPV